MIVFREISFAHNFFPIDLMVLKFHTAQHW